MKKAIITAIILINCTTLYFWAFPYQSKQDLNAFLLADRTLKRQSQIIGVGCESVIGSIAKEAEAYPELKPYEDKAMEIHQLTKANYTIIQKLKDEITGNLPEGYFLKLHDNRDEAFALKYRIRPFQYRIPKKVMSYHLATEASGQAKANKEFADNQSKILELIESDSFKQIVKDSFLVNVNDLPQLFKKTSVMEATALLSGIQTQMKSTEYQLLNHFAIETTNYTNQSRGRQHEFVPIVHANTSNLKIGDTYEAEVFAASYLKNNRVKAYANGKEIPVENGIALYTVKPTSIGKKKVTIKMDITNPLTTKTESFKRDFEYDVVDCN